MITNAKLATRKHLLASHTKIVVLFLYYMKVLNQGFLTDSMHTQHKGVNSSPISSQKHNKKGFMYK